MRRRTFWAIAVVSTAVSVVVLAVVLLAVRRAGIEATRTELTRAATEIVGVLEDTVGTESFNQRSPSDILNRVRSAELGLDLRRVQRLAGGSRLGFAVVNPDGEVRFSEPGQQSLAIDRSIVADGQFQFVEGPRGVLTLVAPVELATRDPRTLLVLLERDTPLIRVGQFIPLAAVIGLAVLGLSALIARMLSDSVIQKLSPLIGAAGRLADGDLTTRVRDIGDPDLEALAMSFNEMADGLEESRSREVDFIAGVGHDLRTPLTTIRGYAEALESGAVSDDDLSRVGSNMGIQARQLGRLIDDLSLLGRLEQPEFALRIEPVDVGAHLGEVVEGFRQRAEASGIQLAYDARNSATVATDADRLVQIVSNLVENSLHFTPEGGSIRVSVRTRPGQLVIRVEDSGQGISVDELPNIFDRHFQGRTGTVRPSGSGLGLSIVKGLTERLGGTVVVNESQLGGAFFEIVLNQ